MSDREVTNRDEAANVNNHGGLFCFPDDQLDRETGRLLGTHLRDDPR